MRLFSLFGARKHTLLLYADDSAGREDVAAFEELAAAAAHAAHGALDVYLIAAAAADVAATVLPLITDSDGDFAARYGVTGPSVFVVRPDGYLAYAERGAAPDADAVVAALRTTFA